MEVFSHYGVGIKTLAIEREPNGRVELTFWAAVFFMPVWALSSWSTIYASPLRPDGINEDNHRIDDPVRIQRDFISYVQTLSTSVMMLALVIAPAAYFIFRTMGQAANSG